MVGEWMMDPIKIPWFRHPGSSWSLAYLVRGGSRPNLTEGSLSAAMGCFVQGYLNLMPLGSIRALAITIIWWCHLASDLFKSKFVVQFKFRSPVVQILSKSLSFLDKISAASRRLPCLGEISGVWASRHVREKRARLVSGDTAAKNLQSHHARERRAWGLQAPHRVPIPPRWRRARIGGFPARDFGLGLRQICRREASTDGRCDCGFWWSLGLQENGSKESRGGFGYIWRQKGRRELGFGWIGVGIGSATGDWSYARSVQQRAGVGLAEGLLKEYGGGDGPTVWRREAER
ncbi:hypothetical protein M5K25_013737 [Dendrobium thyrsiflorum]|uniref:Uncharacterized protein n=1 Tax=Dendrobium thyrsiflorum TaxID=117978 RepID=A0ABD0UU54_DENTH